MNRAPMVERASRRRVGKRSVPPIVDVPEIDSPSRQQASISLEKEKKKGGAWRSSKYLGIRRTPERSVCGGTGRAKKLEEGRLINSSSYIEYAPTNFEKARDGRWHSKGGDFPLSAGWSRTVGKAQRSNEEGEFPLLDVLSFRGGTASHKSKDRDFSGDPKCYADSCVDREKQRCMRQKETYKKKKKIRAARWDFEKAVWKGGVHDSGKCFVRKTTTREIYRGGGTTGTSDRAVNWGGGLLSKPNPVIKTASAA